MQHSCFQASPILHPDCIGKNATRQEKNGAMKHMSGKMPANPSGILIYHPSIQIVGFLLVGVVAALVLPKSASAV
jgi:hypothetical protein